MSPPFNIDTNHCESPSPLSEIRSLLSIVSPETESAYPSLHRRANATTHAAHSWVVVLPMWADQFEPPIRDRSREVYGLQPQEMSPLFLVQILLRMMG